MVPHGLKRLIYQHTKENEVIDKDNLFFPVVAGMAASVNRQTEGQNDCADRQAAADDLRWGGIPLSTANCYERGFRFDEVDRRFK